MIESYNQGCISRTTIGNPAIEPPRLKKIPFYLVLKALKKFFGAFGAKKYP